MSAGKHERSGIVERSDGGWKPEERQVAELKQRSCGSDVTSATLPSRDRQDATPSSPTIGAK